MPAEIHSFIRQEAERAGISQNALMLVLMELGKRVYNDPTVVQDWKIDGPQIGILPPQCEEKIQSERSCSCFRAAQSP